MRRADAYSWQSLDHGPAVSFTQLLLQWVRCVAVQESKETEKKNLLVNILYVHSIDTFFSDTFIKVGTFKKIIFSETCFLSVRLRKKNHNRVCFSCFRVGVSHSQLLVIKDVEQRLDQSVAGQRLVTDDVGKVLLAFQKLLPRSVQEWIA